MSGNGPAKALASLKPFAGIDAARLSALAGQAMMIRVPRGAVIFDQGEVPTAQVILLEGTVHFLGRIGDGPEMLIEAVLHPTSFFPLQCWRSRRTSFGRGQSRSASCSSCPRSRFDPPWRRSPPSRSASSLALPASFAV